MRNLLIFIGVIGIIAALFIPSCSKEIKTKVKTEKVIQSFEDTIMKHQNMANEAKDSVVKVDNVINRAKKHLDSSFYDLSVAEILKDTSRIISVQDTIIKEQKFIINSLERKVNYQNTVIVNQDIVISTSNQEKDFLKNQLNNTEKQLKRLKLKIKIVGVVTTVVGALIIYKTLTHG